MPISFAAIDVETANADLSSICQIGIVTFSDGKVVDHWQSLIDPEDEFDAINVSIHGIDDTTVRGAPRFCDISSAVAQMIGDRVVASDMAFDRVALLASRKNTRLVAPIPCRWIDTARVCRRAWKEFSQRGYGLADVEAHCGITFRHHEAVEDARAAGEVLLRAISETGIGIEEWVSRSNQLRSTRVTAHSKRKPGRGTVRRSGRIHRSAVDAKARSRRFGLRRWMRRRWLRRTNSDCLWSAIKTFAG